MTETGFPSKYDGKKKISQGQKKRKKEQQSYIKHDSGAGSERFCGLGLSAAWNHHGTYGRQDRIRVDQ